MEMKIVKESKWNLFQKKWNCFKCTI